MKTRYLSLTLVTLLFSSFAFSAVEADRAWNSEHRYAISMDPFSWTSGNFRFGLEASFNDRLSFFMPISFGVKETIFKNTYFQGGYFAPKFGVKYYVTGKAAHQGFYVSPLLGFFIGKVDGMKDATAGLTYGFRLGYAWNIWRGIWLDSHLGWETFATSFNGDGNSHNGTDGTAGNNGVPNGDSFAGIGSGANVGIMVGYNW